MSDEPHSTARVSAALSQELRALRQAFLESLNYFIQDVRRFSHEWQTRWNDPVITQNLAEISEALLLTLAGLEAEFSQPEGPSRPQVARLLNTLLGTRDTIGLLPRLQALAAGRAAPPSLDDQRLLSEVDTLFIQLNGLGAEWRDYLALTTTSGHEDTHHSSPLPLLLPPNPQSNQVTDALPLLPRAWPARPADEVDDLPPLLPVRPPRWRQNRSLAGGVSDLLKALLPILLAAVVIIVLVGGILSRLPKSQGHSTPTVPLTAAAQHTPTPPRSSGTSAPSVPTPASPPQLSVNPPALLLPCPGTGAAALQLANTGATPLDWQASIISASGSAPGILLDGENIEGGHLNPGEMTQISVTAQARGAQGSLSISYSDEAAPITVPYRLNC